ncbi:MAG: GGDEF domain-containing protein [Cellulosilyticaceae bacterium]
MMIEDKEKYLILEKAIGSIRWIMIMVTLFSFPTSLYSDPDNFGKIFFLLVFYVIWGTCVHFLVNNNRFNDTTEKRYWVSIIEWGMDIIVIGAMIILFKTPFIGYMMYTLLIVYVFLHYLNHMTSLVLSFLTIMNMALSHTSLYGWEQSIYNEQVGIALIAMMGVATALYIFTKEYASMKMLVDLHYADMAGLKNNIRKMADLTEVTLQMQHSNTQDAIIRNTVFTVSNLMTEASATLLIYAAENTNEQTRLYHFEEVRKAVMNGDETIPFRCVEITEDLMVLRQAREYKNCIQFYEPLNLDGINSLGTFKVLFKKNVEKNYIYLFPVMQHNRESGMIVCNTLYRLETSVCHYIAAIVEQVGTAFARTAMLEEERKKAMYDSLTNVKSRLGLAESIPQIIATSHKCGYSVGCIFIDIDYFKLFNDQYGHNIGDEVLKILAYLIKDNVREQDIVGRYGGEEFVVFLYNVTEEETYQKAEMLRLKIESFDLEETLGIKQPLTASFGVSLYPTDSSEFDDVIKLADQAMYRAKKTRNKVCIYSKEFKKESEEMC